MFVPSVKPKVKLSYFWVKSSAVTSHKYCKGSQVRSTDAFLIRQHNIFCQRAQ